VKQNRITKHGNATVFRDEQGKRVARSLEPVRSAAWRDIIGQMTNNGADLLVRMLAIARGETFTPEGQDEEGRSPRPLVPTIDQQLHAQQLLWEYQHGKAVPQTEVVKAMDAAMEAEQYKAMTDEELWKLANKKRKELASTIEGDEGE